MTDQTRALLCRQDLLNYWSVVFKRDMASADLEVSEGVVTVYLDQVPSLVQMMAFERRLPWEMSLFATVQYSIEGELYGIEDDDEI